MKGVTGFVFLLLALQAAAQSRFSLQQAIDSALANNIIVRQSALNVETARVNWNQARANKLPTLVADITHGINTGRSIDPFSNTYVNQTVNRAGYAIGSDVVLFNGSSLQNRVRESATAYEAARMNWQQEKNNLVLNVMLAYLQVLNGEDQVQQAVSQAATSKQALERLKVLDAEGAIRPSDLTDLKGQLMNDQLAVLDAENRLESSKLLLAQWMNKSYDPAMQLERIDLDEMLTSYPHTSKEVYKESLENFSLIRAAELQTKASGYALKAARGQRFPSLYFGAGLNTNYSSLARDAMQDKISYSNQLKNNRFSSFGIGVSIPIFNASVAKNRVRLSEISLENNRLAEQETKRQLLQLIDQAWLNMSNSYERYQLLVEQVNAYRESFRAAEVRFQSGVGTSVDYLNAKDRMDRAQINLLNAKYDFLLRKRILDFYKGQ